MSSSPLAEKVLKYPRSTIVVFDALLISVAYSLAFLLRFDFQLPVEWRPFFSQTLPVLLLLRVGVFVWFRLYEGIWRYVGMRDILEILKATTLSSLLFAAFVLAVFRNEVPRSVLVLDYVLCLALVGGVRLGIRAYREAGGRIEVGDDGTSRTRALVVGAGEAAEELIRAIRRMPRLHYEIVGLIDDDPFKQRRRIHGVEVIGTIDQIPRIAAARQIEEILIAVPSATPEDRRAIIARCMESGVRLKSVPTLNELLHGKASIAQLHEVKPEDLLGRDPVRVDVESLRREIHGKRVLVTGAGGSIGSELSRQLCNFEPEVLVLYERAESPLYLVHLELRQRFPDLKVVPVVGDILDERKLAEVMETHAPDLVYHAAAYKHVPLMEEHPLQAIENNVIGTETVALAARSAGVKKLVFISTDKAVRPVGIMGMTKRVAEDLLLALDPRSTAFVAVRFGNVLGSEGSVLPLFRQQMVSGGPVTVTDAEASRYFMLIPEAAQLVLQAGALGTGREVFFLDMGEPIRILDLAENFIRLSGLVPGRDVRVEMIGLRPGERLREELVMEVEDLAESEHEKIFVLKKRHFDPASFRRDFDELKKAVRDRDAETASSLLKVMAGRY